MKQKIQFVIFFVMVRVLSALSMHTVLAKLSKPFVKEIDNTMSLNPVADKNDPSVVNVLVLSREHFRGDIHVLAKRDDVRCLDLSTQFQWFLLRCFVKEPSADAQINSEWGVRSEFRMAPPGSEIYEARSRYRKFLRKFLPIFLKQFHVDIVVNSDERWRRQADLTRVATEQGFPHVCIEREAMFLSDALFHNSFERHKRLGKFHGHMLAVQNQSVKDILVGSGYAKEDQVMISGCLRMDSLLEQLKNAPGHQPDKKRVLMFTWQDSKVLRDGTIIDVFDATKACVRAMTRLALKRPDVEFIIKFKEIHLRTVKKVHLKPEDRDAGIRKGQKDVLQDVIREMSDDGEIPDNFVFNADNFATADLIESATVICGMQSTTVLEAGIAGKPIILPHFAFLRDKPGADQYLFYRDCYHLFDVPHDEFEMEALLAQRLDDPSVPEMTTKAIQELFDRYVSPIDGQATERLVAYFKTVSNKS